MFSLASKAKPYLGAVVLTTLLLIGGGVYSAFRMPSGIYPEVTFPRIGVVAKAPGLDLTTMDLKVTRPLEEAVSSVIGVSEVRSKTIRGGTELSITCTPGTDMIRAEQLVWNHIGSKHAELPANLSLTVEQMTPSVFPIISLVLTGGDNAAQLRDYAFYHLAPRIKALPDVYLAEVAGGDVREIEVIVRPEALLAHGLSAADLADQIAQTSLLQPAGRIQSDPLSYQILIDNQSHTVKQIEDLVVSARKDQPLRVKDVADVQVLHADRVQSVGYDQKDAVILTVFRRVGGNTINISNDVRALLDKDGLTLAPDDPHKRPPHNIQVTPVYDQSKFVETSVGNVRDAILLGGLFSIIILMVFLRSWRATAISALAIPTTLAITFLFLYWSGQTLNLMSLGGLAVAVGLVIDDTVVVVENIARHLTPAGKSPPTPALPRKGGGSQTATPPHNGAGGLTPSPLAGEGGGGGSIDPVDAASKEITGAVIGSTLTTVVVFVPLAFIVGVYGQFFAALSWSLCIAVLVSMVVSLTIVPVFAAKFLAGSPMPGPGPIYRFLAHLYDLLLLFVLRFPVLTILTSVAAAGFGALLYYGIPNVFATHEAGKPPPAPLVAGLETGLMPVMDEGAFTLDYWAPSGLPLADTVRRAQVLEGILSKNPDVQSYVRRTGSENGLYATQSNRGDISVVLRPAEQDPINLATKGVRPPLETLEKELEKQGKKLDAKEIENIRRKYRRRSALEIMAEVTDAVNDQFAEHQLKVETVQVMQDELDDLSGANKPIEVQLFGPDQTQLRQLARDVATVLEEKGAGHGLEGVNSNASGSNPDLMIRVDGERADRIGFKPEAVTRQMRAMFEGQIAAQVPESSIRLTDVRVRYPDDIRFGPGRFDPGLLDRFWLMLPDTKAPPPGVPQGPARSVPVGALASVTPTRTADAQYRDNLQPFAFVTADLNTQQAGLGAVATDVKRWMAAVPMPVGYRWELGGHILQQSAAFESLLLVMLTAVFLVYVMLAFQFRSAALPLVIFLTQPLSIVSGLFALWLTHTPLNVSSYMGAILLVGLDMKNGILLVEYIQKLRAEGMALQPALLLAGQTRFRPILMTSLAAILGLAPLALGIGPGAQMQQPLAIMVIGGLTANMLFTRAVIPAGYEVLERILGRQAEGVAVAPAGVIPLVPGQPREGSSKSEGAMLSRAGQEASSGPNPAKA